MKTRPAVPLLSLALLLAALLTPPLLRAEETTPPLRDFEATVAAFPAPAEALGFDVRGRITVEGVAVGSFRVAVGLGPRGDTVHWSLVEERKTTLNRATREIHARAATDAALQPTSGSTRKTDEFGDVLLHEWKPDERGYRVETRGPSRRPMSRSAAKEGPCLTSLAGLVLFGRLVPAMDASYEARLFYPDWNYLEAERPFVKTRLVVDTGTEGAEVLRLTAIQERARFELELDAATRDLRRLTIREKDRPVLVFQPGPQDATDLDSPAGDLFAAPSPTPQGCAARVALAFATGDAELFAAVIHWPTMRAATRAGITGEVTDEQFRAAILAEFRKQGEGREPDDRAEAEAHIRKEAPGFQVESSGDEEAAVTLTAAWASMRLTFRRVDGTWYLARLPGS